MSYQNNEAAAPPQDDRPQSIGAIWKKVSKGGMEYLSINVGDGQFVAFPARKTSDRSPDYRIYVSTPKSNSEPKQQQPPSVPEDDGIPW